MMCRDHSSHWMHLTAEIFADLSGPTNSILQRRIDINTGVLCHDESEPSCAHGVVVCVDELDYLAEFWT